MPSPPLSKMAFVRIAFPLPDASMPLRPLNAMTSPEIDVFEPVIRSPCAVAERMGEARVRADVVVQHRVPGRLEDDARSDVAGD